MAPTSIPSLRDVFRIVFRQKYRATLTLLLVTGLSVAVIVFSPRTYVSEAQLYIRVGREDVAMDPVATPGESMQVTIDRESEIRSLMQMLQSRGVYGSVVEAIGPAAILQEAVPGEADTPVERTMWFEKLDEVRGWLSEAMDGANVTDEEKAIKRLTKWIEVDAEKKASLLTVTCKCGSPKLARLVLEHVIEEFQKRHILAHQSEGTMEFFAEQREHLRNELDVAAHKLRDEKNRVGVVSVEVERDIIRAEIDSLNGSISLESSALAEAAMRLEALQKQYPQATVGLAEVGILPSNDQQATGTTVQALDEMRKELYSLQLRDQALAAKFFDEHPDRQAIRQQVAEGKRILAEHELRLEHSNVAKFTSHLGSLEERMTDAKEKLQHLNRSEVELKNSEEEVARLERALNQYSENYEVARINEALGTERITNVRVTQEPSLQNKAIGPKKMVLAVLGLMGGLLAAAGVAVGSEYLDPTLKTTDEVEAELDAPVLVSIPRLPQHRVRMES